MPHLRRDCAHTCHITPTSSHLQRDWAPRAYSALRFAAQGRARGIRRRAARAVRPHVRRMACCNAPSRSTARAAHAAESHRRHERRRHPCRRRLGVANCLAALLEAVSGRDLPVVFTFLISRALRDASEEARLPRRPRLAVLRDPPHAGTRLTRWRPSDCRLRRVMSRASPRQSARHSQHTDACDSVITLASRSSPRTRIRFTGSRGDDRRRARAAKRARRGSHGDDAAGARRLSRKAVDGRGDGHGAEPNTNPAHRKETNIGG